MGREEFGLDPKTSWGWLKGTLSERIFMTLVDASNETKSLVLVGVLVGWEKRVKKKEKKEEGGSRRERDSWLIKPGVLHLWGQHDSVILHPGSKRSRKQTTLKWLTVVRLKRYRSLQTACANKQKSAKALLVSKLSQLLQCELAVWVRVGTVCFLIRLFFFSVFEFLCVWGDNTAPQQWPFLTHLARSRSGEHSEDRGRKNNCLPACWETLQARQSWWWREDRWMKVTGEVDNNPSDYVWLEDYPLTCLWPPKALPFSFCIINSLLINRFYSVRGLILN